MTDTTETPWGWLLGIGATIIAFLSGRLLIKYDEEIEKLRKKNHDQDGELHKLGLEIEHFKTEVATDYVRKSRK